MDCPIVNSRFVGSTISATLTCMRQLTDVLHDCVLNSRDHVNLDLFVSWCKCNRKSCIQSALNIILH